MIQSNSNIGSYLLYSLHCNSGDILLKCQKLFAQINALWIGWNWSPFAARNFGNTKIARAHVTKTAQQGYFKPKLDRISAIFCVCGTLCTRLHLNCNALPRITSLQLSDWSVCINNKKIAHFFFRSSTLRLNICAVYYYTSAIALSSSPAALATYSRSRIFDFAKHSSERCTAPEPQPTRITMLIVYDKRKQQPAQQQTHKNRISKSQHWTS